MAYKHEGYKPNEASRAILGAAWEHIRTVPYKVTTRWLFYQLLQDGFYKSKDDYSGKCIPLLSRVRHNQWEGWRPDMLVDDRRSAIVHTGGNRSVEEWFRELGENGVGCRLDHWYCQEKYCEVWFEAEAMQRQFEYYVKGVTLRPFSGMPSIDYKWQIAKDLEAMQRRYNLPMTVLYFGDYDGAGLTIPKTSEADIRGWCRADFDFVRVGLNEGDAARYHIPENFDKPDTYQWEALSDESAREIITTTIESYVDIGAIESCRKVARTAEDTFQKLCQAAILGADGSMTA